MKTKNYFVTNSSSVSFILSDFRDKGGDIIVHFNASKKYNIVELTKEEVELGMIYREEFDGELTEYEQKQAKNILDRGGRVLYSSIMDDMFMHFLETKKGIRIVSRGGY